MLGRPAAASFLDSAFCQVLGCVVVWNSAEGEIYLTFGGGGGPATFYAATANAPPTRSVATGTTTPVPDPGAGEGRRLAIDLTGNGNPDLRPTDPTGNGMLDATDLLPPVSLGPRTGVVYETNRESRSFWVCSNGPFQLFAALRPVAAGGAFGTNVDPRQFRYRLFARRRGTDAGYRYGNAATIAGFRREPGIGQLADLSPGPRRVARFTRGTAAANVPDFNDQCVRMEGRIQLTRFDLSLGAGEQVLELDYLIYRP